MTPPGKAAVACLINRSQAKRNSDLVAYRERIKVLPLVLMAGII
ncbi:MAG: hypothetical protein ACRCT1_14275 [Microcoleaceae cyanobacterium]